ncbi:MAG: AI-2E family transporter [Longicatena sp.]
MFTDKDKKINRLTMKNILFIITFTIGLIWVILNINEVVDALFIVIALCKPFIYGFSIAYVFNLPLKFFLKKLPDSLGKLKKGVAALLSLLIIGIILSFIFRIVVPQVVDSISMLIASIPGYFSSIQKTMEQMILDKDIPQEVFEQIGAYSQQIQETLLNILKHGLPEIYSLATGFASSIANIFLALVIAVYLTVSKNKLIEQLKRFFYAFTSEKVNTYAIKVVRLTNKTFSAFITGQLIEAIIIGVLCYIGCLILRFPYAPILSVIIGCTNVIPIFGAICGVGICALLVAFVSPLQGIFFVIFGICLQQFECNLIYPRVVGTSVGLSGLWVLFAITIGGGLFGFVGMLLGLPTFSVIYFLLRDEMNRRIDEKKHKEREIIESV